MKVIHNPVTPAVTQIVTPAKPETFDLIGLSVEQVACITILVGGCAGDAVGTYNLYDSCFKALGIENEDMPLLETLLIVGAVCTYPAKL